MKVNLSGKLHNKMTRLKGMKYNLSLVTESVRIIPRKRNTKMSLVRGMFAVAYVLNVIL